MSTPNSGAPVESTGKVFTKVYWPETEKRAFAEEAAKHGQTASEYARFILQAREDPVLFLQICRLLHPDFARTLIAGTRPSDITRTTELEQERAQLLKQRDKLESETDRLRSEEEALEHRLADASQHVASLSAELASLMRAQDSNRERALRLGIPYDGVSRALLAIVKLLSMHGRLLGNDLEARLTADERIPPAEATAAATLAMHLELIVPARDGRYALARPSAEEDQ